MTKDQRATELREMAEDIARWGRWLAKYKVQTPMWHLHLHGISCAIRSYNSFKEGKS